MPDPCTYVTERAPDGPCQQITVGVTSGGDGWPYGPIHCSVKRAHHDMDGAHDYLGPVTARCGVYHMATRFEDHDFTTKERA